MKHLKRFNESIEQPLDVDVFITKIKEEFPQEKVNQMLQDEIVEWVDDEQSYQENGNGEAEESIVYQMLSWYAKKFEVELNDLEENPEVIEEIEKTYPNLRIKQ